MIALAPLWARIFGVVAFSLIALFFFSILALGISENIQDRKAAKKWRMVDGIDEWYEQEMDSILTQQSPNSNNIMYPAWQSVQASRSVNEEESIIPPELPLVWPAYRFIDGSEYIHRYINELHELVKDLQEQVDELSEGK